MVVQRILGLLVHDLVDNPNGITKVWQELDTRRTKLCFIKIVGETLNRDIRLHEATSPFQR